MTAGDDGVGPREPPDIMNRRLILLPKQGLYRVFWWQKGRYSKLDITGQEVYHLLRLESRPDKPD